MEKRASGKVTDGLIEKYWDTLKKDPDINLFKIIILDAYYAGFQRAVDLVGIKREVV